MNKREGWMGFLLIFIAVTARVQVASLTGLRFGQHPERTRIVLDFLGIPPEYSIQEGKDRVEILVKNSSTTRPGPWPITDVRVKEISLSTEGGMARVSIRLKRPVKVSASVLREPYRIVLDLTDKIGEEKPAPAHLLGVERVPQENGERWVLTFDRIPPYTSSEDKTADLFWIDFIGTEMPEETLQKQWQDSLQFSATSDGLRMKILLKGVQVERFFPLPQEEKIIFNFQNIPGAIAGATSEKPAEEPSGKGPSPAEGFTPSTLPEPQEVTLFQSQEEILRAVTGEVKGKETYLTLEFSQPVNFIARSQPPSYRLVFLDLYLPDIPEPLIRLPGVESFRISSVPAGSRFTLTLAESYRVILVAQTMKITLQIKPEEIH